MSGIDEARSQRFTRRTFVGAVGAYATARTGLALMGSASGDHDLNGIEGDQGYVLLTFDDFPGLSPLDVAFPIMERHDFVGTFGIVVDRVDTDEEEAEAQRLVDAGWEAAIHTATHEDLAEASESTIEDEVCRPVEWLDERGYKTGDIVLIYPYSSVDGLAKETARDCMTFGFGGPHDPPTWSDPLEIGRVRGHEPDDLYSGLERASDEGETVIPMFHGVTEDGETERPNDIEESDFAEVMEYIAEDGNLEVILPTEYERLLDEGGDSDSDKSSDKTSDEEVLG